MKKRFKLKLLALLFLALSIHGIKANNNVQATLQKAVVYLQGASLSHTANVFLKKGSNTLVINGLSANIDTKSLRITTTKGNIVSSVQYLLDTTINELPNKKDSIQLMNDSIEILQQEIEKVGDIISTNNAVIQFLQIDPKILNKDGNSHLTELMKYTQYLKIELTELATEKWRSLHEKAILEKKIIKLQSSINKIKNKQKSKGLVKLQIMSPTGGACNLQIEYYTKSASWEPFYTINVVSAEQPIQIVAQAKIKQTTGIDWNNVKLTLSSTRPQTDKVAPNLNTWFLYNRSNLVNEKNPMTLRALAGGGLKQANPTSFASSASEDNLNKLYIVDGVEVTSEYALSIDPSTIKSTINISSENAIKIYGDKASSGATIIELRSSMNDYVVQTENILDTTYDIDLNYTISGDGKEQSIDVQTKKISAKFSYYAVPKLSSNVYLLAEVDDWQNLALLTGKASIIYNGTYVAKTIINANEAHNKIKLTLGTDDRISVVRRKIEDFSSKKIFTNNIEQAYTYDIIVKNNHNKSINIFIKDQYPISTEKNIEVELAKETTQATELDKERGILTWNFDLKPRELKTLKLAYTIKYPQNIQLNL